MDLNLDLQPAVLLYNIRNGARAAKIREYLTSTGVRLIDVLPADYRQPLGALAGVPGFARTASYHMGGGIDEEMLIMYQFDDLRMEAFFAFFRTEGLASIALKAVVTPTNAAWNSLELHRELSREHEAIMAQRNRSRTRDEKKR